MGKRYLTVLLSLLLVPALVRVASGQTVDEVIEKHLAAVGGRDVLGKLTSRKATGTVTITTPAGDLSGPIEIDAKLPNKTRVSMQLDLSPLGANQVMDVEQRFDGTSGRTANSLQGTAEIAGNELDNMRNNTFPNTLLDYKTLGLKVELLPREQLAGKDVLVLLVTPKAGSVVRMYFDAGTYLVVRIVTKVNIPEAGGDLEQTGEPSDYRTVDGVKVPFRIVNSSSLQTVTITLDKVEHNIALDDALFAIK
jgi:hypothetical protein